jgi:hypothetical protein
VTSHAVSGVVHAPVWHEPLSHLFPAAHGVAVHEPQWSGSERKSKHDVPQSVMLGKQVHAPAAQ